MATVPTPKLSLEAQNRVVRDGHCPQLAGIMEAKSHPPPACTYEQMQKIARDRGWS